MRKNTLPGLGPVLAATTACLITLPGLHAQELTPAEQKKVSAMIEELDSKLLGGTEKNNNRAVTTCRAALKSTKATYQFFMEATKALDFDQAGKRESDWREWRTRNEDRYKSTEHIAALQYQLRYLILTLTVANTQDQDEAIGKALPELVEYYDSLAKNFEKLETHHRLLGNSVLESVFARKLKLDVTVAPNQSWVYSPLPVSHSYDQLILPFYRKAKDHRMLQGAWDKRIIHESRTLDAEEASDAPGPGLPGRGPGRRFNRDPREREREERREEGRQKKVSEADFESERLPELQWGKARDELFFGTDRAAALAALGRVLRENLSHRQAIAWLGELKTLAKGEWKAETYYNQDGP